jgi:hypothetical protein
MDPLACKVRLGDWIDDLTGLKPDLRASAIGKR